MDHPGDRQQRRHAVHHLEERACLGGCEALRDHAVDRADQRCRRSRDVANVDRLVVQAQLPPADDLDRFIQRADAAGQRDEGICRLGHAALAVVQAVDDGKLGDALMRHIQFREKVGDHAKHRAAGLEHRVGEHAHHAVLAAAVNQPDAGTTQPHGQAHRRRRQIPAASPVGSRKTLRRNLSRA